MRGRGAGCREGRRVAALHAACRGGIDYRLGAGYGEERTLNMAYVFVALEVSKLSSWLNADATCRESNGGHAVRGEVRPGWREAAGDRGACSVHGKGSTADSGGGAHEEHLAHSCDAGGVEAQRLVER